MKVMLLQLLIPFQSIHKSEISYKHIIQIDFSNRTLQCNHAIDIITFYSNRLKSLGCIK